MTAPKKVLSLFDSTSIIVGIIIGAGIYENAPLVASSMGSSAATLMIWLAGGLIALAGALCYAELASAYPEAGGDYVYLKRAYGKPVGFMFGWAQLAIVRPGDITLMAFIFARYAGKLYPAGESGIGYAVGAIVVLTLINMLGVRGGKWTQNVLTCAKVIGLFAIVAAGLLAPAPPPPPTIDAATAAPFAGNLELALILVLFTYGGWNEMAYVAGEIKNPEKNIFRGLVIGTIAVTGLYLLINVAFFGALGFDGVAESDAVAVDTMAATFPDLAGRVIAVIICISALGAINGLVLTGSRITYALGRDHAVFKPLGSWDVERGAPMMALSVQAIISVSIVVLAGSFIDTILYAAPVVWGFMVMTGLSLPLLRWLEPQTPRPYRVTGHYLTVLIFCACGVFMLYSATTYAMAVKPIGLAVLMGVMGMGLVVYGLCGVWESKAR